MKELLIESSYGTVILIASPSDKKMLVIYKFTVIPSGIEFLEFYQENKKLIETFKEEADIDFLILKLPKIHPVINFEEGQESVKVSLDIFELNLEFILHYSHTNKVICPETKFEPEHSESIFEPEDVTNITIFKGSEELIPTTNQLAEIHFILDLKIISLYEKR